MPYNDVLDVFTLTKETLKKLLKIHALFLFLCRGRKMNASLEKAIQEAMMELDNMTD